MSKDELRREARERLRAMTPEQRLEAGAEIARLVWTLPEVAVARTLLLYAALPEEVPTETIAREAWRRGVTVTFPRCLPQTREMALHDVRTWEQLRSGRYGILEPDAACPLLGLEQIDAALVPGLAWDPDGRRLGRGAGYYDRLFAQSAWRGFRCGLFFAAQRFPRLPADPWDVPLHAVVTEEGIWRCDYEC